MSTSITIDFSGVIQLAKDKCTSPLELSSEELAPFIHGASIQEIRNLYCSTFTHPEIKTACSILDRYGVPQTLYSIGAEKDDALCLIYDGRRWEVFYVERGMKCNIHQFWRLAPACEKMIEMLLAPEDDIGGALLDYRNKLKGAI